MTANGEAGPRSLIPIVLLPLPISPHLGKHTCNTQMSTMYKHVHRCIDSHMCVYLPAFINTHTHSLTCLCKDTHASIHAGNARSCIIIPVDSHMVHPPRCAGSHICTHTHIFTHTFTYTHSVPHTILCVLTLCTCFFPSL